MRISLVTRLKKLELARVKQGPNRIRYYSPQGLRVLPRKTGRFLLVPNFGSDAEWEAGVYAQQRRLIAEAMGKKKE